MFSFDSFSGEWIILKQLDILVIAQALGQDGSILAKIGFWLFKD